MAVYLFSSLATSPNLFVNVPRIEASNRLKFEVECRVKLTTESLTGDLPILGLEDNSKGIKVFINDGSFGVLHSDYWSISKWLTDPAVRTEGNYTIKYRVDKEAGQNATARLYVDDVLVDEDLNYGTNETALNAIDRLFRMTVTNSNKFYGGLYWFKFTDLVTPANNRHYVMDDYSDVDDTVVDRITGTETLTIGNNPNDGSIWVDDGASAEADFSLDTSLRYGSTFSGSFADLSAAPNNYLTITDGVHTAQVPITVTITDAPTNTGTFVSDAPLALPSAPLSGATDSVTGVGWNIGDVTVTFNAQTVATILNAPAGYGAVTVSATPVTDVFTASGWQAGDLPVENEQLLFETRDSTTVDTDLNISTDAVDDELHFYLIRLDGSVESFWVTSDNIAAYSYGSEPSNVVPVANAGADQTVNGNTTVTLTGLGSNDSDGTIANYTWTQLSGESVTLDLTNPAQPTFISPSNPSGDTLVFQLRVTDNEGGLSTPDTVTINVNAVAPSNVLPTANAGLNQLVEAGTVVQLDASSSFDTDGAIATYNWVQSAGDTVTLSDNTAASPTFVAPDLPISQTIEFQLTVTDNLGGVSLPDTVSIVVSANDEGVEMPLLYQNLRLVSKGINNFPDRYEYVDNTVLMSQIANTDFFTKIKGNALVDIQAQDGFYTVKVVNGVMSRVNGTLGSTAMPTEGSWKLGDYVRNINPTVLGSASSQYVLKGWTRLTTGSDHVLNTDWVEDRALTGT